MQKNNTYKINFKSSWATFRKNKLQEGDVPYFVDFINIVSELAEQGNDIFQYLDECETKNKIINSYTTTKDFNPAVDEDAIITLCFETSSELNANDVMNLNNFLSYQLVDGWGEGEDLTLFDWEIIDEENNLIFPIYLIHILESFNAFSNDEVDIYKYLIGFNPNRLKFETYHYDFYLQYVTVMECVRAQDFESYFNVVYLNNSPNSLSETAKTLVYGDLLPLVEGWISQLDYLIENP